jgi:hypothetical protein
MAPVHGWLVAGEEKDDHHPVMLAIRKQVRAGGVWIVLCLGEPHRIST